MDDKSKKGKGVDDSFPLSSRKDRFKFKIEVPKRDRKNRPQMNPQEMNLQVNLETSQSTDTLQTRAEVETKVGQDKDEHLSGKSILSDVTTSTAKLPKDYAEPQDYNHPDYEYASITLPLRRPDSRDQVDDEYVEFSSSGLTEAEELGLMDKDISSKPQFLFFQFPISLPSVEPVVESVAVADIDTSEDVKIDGTKCMETSKTRRHDSIGCGRLKDMPGGLMGKLLVYKSGKMTMSLGDIPFNVSTGINNKSYEGAVAINIKEKHCCSLGDVHKRVIVTPDTDSILEDSAERE